MTTEGKQRAPLADTVIVPGSDIDCEPHTGYLEPSLAVALAQIRPGTLCCAADAASFYWRHHTHRENVVPVRHHLAHTERGGFMAEVIVRDETMVGRPIGEWVLPDLPARMSARELVRLRVREEVARFNAAPPRRDSFRGLVRPADPARPRLDWELQADAACAGFASNAFVIIAGDRQIEDLDEIIDLERAHAVAFIKLTPLVGG